LRQERYGFALAVGLRPKRESLRNALRLT